jgi:hypothetical protein
VIFSIPLPADGTPFIQQQVELDGKSYDLDLKYNFRSGSWVISVSFEGDPIVSGRRLTMCMNVFLRATHSSTPPGALIPFNDLDGLTPPTLDTLGQVVQLYYWDAEEVTT